MVFVQAGEHHGDAEDTEDNRLRAGKPFVILIAAKYLVAAPPRQILRCAQDDGWGVNGEPFTGWHST